jgi:hypothetical protein
MSGLNGKGCESHTSNKNSYNNNDDDTTLHDTNQLRRGKSEVSRTILKFTNAERYRAWAMES